MTESELDKINFGTPPCRLTLQGYEPPVPMGSNGQEVEAAKAAIQMFAEERFGHGEEGPYVIEGPYLIEEPIERFDWHLQLSTGQTLQFRGEFLPYLVPVEKSVLLHDPSAVCQKLWEFWGRYPDLRDDTGRNEDSVPRFLRNASGKSGLTREEDWVDALEAVKTCDHAARSGFVLSGTGAYGFAAQRRGA